MLGEDFTVALTREVKEEVGLDIVIHRLAGSAQSETPTRVVVYLITEAKPLGKSTVSLSDEHTASRWVTAEELRDLDLCTQFREFVKSWTG